MIRLHAVSKSFGDIEAVKQVSFDIPTSKLTILAGADGAGKSTIFKMLVGLVKPDGGDILLNGESIAGDYGKVTAVAGYMPERFSLYPDLSVEENMNFFADIHRVPRDLRETRKQDMLERTGMSRFRKRRAGALSGGMKQKLALGTILLSAPRLIILDEPTTGVDPLSRIEFFRIIGQLKEEGKTIVVSTPYLDEAEQGDYIVFLKDGNVIHKDDIQHLRENFPARLFRIRPKGNIFELMNTLKQDPRLRDNVYIRGKFIKYIRTGDEHLIDGIPHDGIEEEAPKLEDMYIYYERLRTFRAHAPGE
jgi:ABC-2 type transport system ATP-binding protein